MTNKIENINLLEKFRAYQKRQPLNKEDAFDQAQLAISDIIQAFHGLLTEEKILIAIGDAKSPNAVSRAVRNRLPPLK